RAAAARGVVCPAGPGALGLGAQPQPGPASGRTPPPCPEGPGPSRPRRPRGHSPARLRGDDQQPSGPGPPPRPVGGDHALRAGGVPPQGSSRVRPGLRRIPAMTTSASPTNSARPAGGSAENAAYLVYGQIAEEVKACLRDGREPDLEALAARYPELADQVAQLLPAMLVLHQLGAEPPAAGALSAEGVKAL